jgi:hypothetical protein
MFIFSRILNQGCGKMPTIKFISNSIILLLLSVFLFSLPGNCLAKEENNVKHDLPRLGILPIQAIGIDINEVTTIENMLKAELQTLMLDHAVLGSYGLNISEYEACSELECALQIGRDKDLDLVLVCNMSSLGDRIYLQYMLADVNKAEMIVADNTTTAKIEDMESVTQRIALSVTHRKGLDDVARIGAIMDDEAMSSKRRKGYNFKAVNFGYLHPKRGYDDKDRLFYFEFIRGIETERFNVGFSMAYNRGAAVGLVANYLLTTTDICPYIGGGLGFNWVYHKDLIDEFREDGFQVKVGGGFRFLRTYDFQVQLGCSYSWTFNDYEDEALMLTIGFSK